MMLASNTPAQDEHRVLVVDDEPRNRKLFHALLVANGYGCLEAEHAQHALEILARERVDAILLDVNMPGMNGIELTRHLKRQPHTHTIPIILITAIQDRQIRRDGLRAGAEDFLTKPTDHVELSARLRNLLRLRSYSALLEEQNRDLNDIVERRTRESKRAAEFMRNTLDAVQAQIAILDEDMAIIETNQAWRELAHLSPHVGPIGANYHDLLPADHPIRRGLHTVLRGERDNFHYEYSCAAPGGTRWLLAEISRFEERGDAYLVVAHHEVTERHQATEQLRDNEALYRALVETAPDRIMLLDNTDRVVFTGGAEGDDEADEGTPVFELVLEADHEPLRQAIRTAWQSDDVIHLRLQVHGPDGELQWYAIRFRRLAFANSEDRLLLFWTDITQRVAAEEALKVSREHLHQHQRLESLGQLAGGISHDFNNLLAVIQGYASFLHRQVRDDPEMTSDVEQIIEACRRASILTQRLLAFSRRSSYAPTACQLNTLVQNMETMLGRLIEEHVQVHYNLSDTLPPILVDARQIEQVIMNLVINARDAMPQGGSLNLSTGRRLVTEADLIACPELRLGDFVTLTVQDSGCGMTPDVLARIFEPFFTTKGPDKGTGLGLATVYGIVQQSEGCIRVQSEPDVGTTFTVFLPALLDSETQSIPHPPTTESQSDARSGGTILVVEDEDMVRDIVRRVLHREGYRVLCASNAGEALLLSERLNEPLDLLLSDIVMPVMNGIELYERLQAQRPNLTALFMTGYADDAALEYGLTSSRNLIEKPFSPDDLAKTVRSAIADSSTLDTP